MSEQSNSVSKVFSKDDFIAMETFIQIAERFGGKLDPEKTSEVKPGPGLVGENKIRLHIRFDGDYDTFSDEFQLLLGR